MLLPSSPARAHVVSNSLYTFVAHDGHAIVDRLDVLNNTHRQLSIPAHTNTLSGLTNLPSLSILFTLHVFGS